MAAVVNGKLTASQLTALRTADGQRLAKDAAASWDKLAAAYTARTGGRHLAVTDTYRPRDVQERIFRERYVAQRTGGGFYGDVRIWDGVRYVRRRGHAAAAVPGTSNHGLGLAVDAGIGSFTSQAYKDLSAIAGHYGWSNAAGKRINEPWHWEYNRAADKSAGASGSDTDGVLAVGDSGPEVTKLQKGLNDAFPAYSKLKVDGQFGPATAAVVAEFQRRAKLVADGVVGPKTRAALAKNGVKL